MGKLEEGRVGNQKRIPLKETSRKKRSEGRSFEAKGKIISCKKIGALIIIVKKLNILKRIVYRFNVASDIN